MRMPQTPLELRPPGSVFPLETKPKEPRQEKETGGLRPMEGWCWQCAPILCYAHPQAVHTPGKSGWYLRPHTKPRPCGWEEGQGHQNGEGRWLVPSHPCLGARRTPLSWAGSHCRPHAAGFPRGRSGRIGASRKDELVAFISVVMNLFQCVLEKDKN